jgi:hypothetical protein
MNVESNCEGKSSQVRPYYMERQNILPGRSTLEYFFEVLYTKVHLAVAMHTGNLPLLKTVNSGPIEWIIGTLRLKHLSSNFKKGCRLKSVIQNLKFSLN